MSGELMIALRQIVREELGRLLGPHHQAVRIESMTVAEFAYVIRLHEDTVLLKIRRRSISSEHVSKKAKAYRIRPGALDAFGVSAPEAAARLAEFRALSGGQYAAKIAA